MLVSVKCSFLWGNVIAGAVALEVCMKCELNGLSVHAQNVDQQGHMCKQLLMVTDTINTRQAA